MTRILAVSVGACIALITFWPAHAITIDTVAVGSAGNPNDIEGEGYGAVDYEFRLGTFEVTNSQYVEFLNEVDLTGANSLKLFPDLMRNSTSVSFADDRPDGQKYSAAPEHAMNPVTAIGYFSALRFANWLHNGQGAGDTESGAYTLLGGTSVPSNWASITRSPDATWFLPNEDEWYKAAYFDPPTGSYFDYPTKSDSLPTSEAPPGGNNSANYKGTSGFAVTGSPEFESHINYFTDVGAYANAIGPFGTFDQGGNVSEWIEGIYLPGDNEVFFLAGAFHRGGSWLFEGERLSAAFRGISGPGPDGTFTTGFRVGTMSTTEPLVGDFDINGLLDVADLDLLAQAIRMSGDGPQFDVTRDGLVDDADLVHWVATIKNTWFGDADLNGQFDSSDLVQVFQSGEYEDAAAQNSTWATGDWDTDGEFTTSDLVVAFQDGGYEQGPKLRANVVPEPTSVAAALVIALVCQLAHATRRKKRNASLGCSWKRSRPVYKNSDGFCESVRRSRAENPPKEFLPMLEKCSDETRCG